MPHESTASISDAGNSFNSAVEFSDSVNEKRDRRKNRVLELLGKYSPYHPEGLAGLTSTEGGREGLKNLGIAIPANLLGLPSDLASIPTAISEQIEELYDPLSGFIPSEEESSLFNLPFGSVDLAERMGGDPESYPFVAGSFLTPDPTKAFKGLAAAREGIPLIVGAIRKGGGTKKAAPKVIDLKQVRIEKGIKLQKQYQVLGKQKDELEKILREYWQDSNLPNLLKDTKPQKTWEKLLDELPWSAGSKAERRQLKELKKVIKKHSKQRRKALADLERQFPLQTKKIKTDLIHESRLKDDQVAAFRRELYKLRYREPTLEEVRGAMQVHLFDNLYPKIHNNDGTLRRFESPEEAMRLYEEVLQLRDQNKKARESIWKELTNVRDALAKQNYL